MDTEEQTVAHRYRLVVELGRGGMGVVWRARDERLGRDVALKVLHPWVADDPELRERFEREAAALARLEHPNVVRLYDVLEDGGRTLLVMELVDGDALDTIIRERSLGWDEARRLTAPAAAALAHAHARGVVHRDLTPGNVLIERGTGRVVVTDFGLARLARSSRSAPISGVLAGTPEYWAPEQAAGIETGPATDLYALGCILFRMLSGRMPFEGEDRLATGLRRAHEAAPRLAAVVPDAPPAAAALVDRLLDRDPAIRGDAAEAAVALGAESAALPGPSGPPHLPGAAGDARAGSTHTLSAPTLVTRVMRVPAAVARRSQEGRLEHRSARRGGRALVLLAVLVAIGVAGGGVYAVAGDEPAGVSARNVVGWRVGAARADLTKRARNDGLPVPRVKIVDRSYSESAPAGAIIAQDPPEGKRIPANGALLVSVSRGSAYAAVPSVTGLEGAAAAALLERGGFTPTRRYAPSTEIAPWHAVDTDPETGTKLRRPARVTLVVSTGPPKRFVPALTGLDADGAARVLREAGFSPVVEERPETAVAPGAVLGVSPSPGTRIALGSTVTIAIARAPRWDAVTRLEGTEDASPPPIRVPAGARLVLATTDTSPLGLWGGTVAVELAGDTSGSAEIDAGRSLVLADRSESDRKIAVEVDVHGSAHWTLAVEVPR